MQTDGLTPLAFGDKDGWPAMGTFDILNMRVNGYQYHIELMKGAQKWTDPKTAAVFRPGRSSCRSTVTSPRPSAGPGRTRPTCSSRRRPGCTSSARSPASRPPRQADHDDLDFFPFPTLGTEFDSELGIDAPIDGFMMTAKSPTLATDKDAALAFLEYLSSGPAQITFLVANPNSVAAGNDADTSGYSAFQKKSAEIIGGIEGASPSSSTATPTRASPSRCRASCRPG